MRSSWRHPLLGTGHQGRGYAADLRRRPLTVDFIIQLVSDPVAFYQTHTVLIAQIGINSILAASMFLVLYSGQLSLAAPGFMAIGAYTSVLMGLYWNTPLALNLLGGTLLAGAAGFLVGLPVLRLRGVFLAIATIGFIEALTEGVILNLPITGEGLGLKNPSADPLTGINLILLSVVVVVFVVWRLTRGRLGRAWAAIRQDELAALSQGIHVARYKMIAFVLSAVLAGFAGGLESHLNFFVDPNEYGVTRTVQVLTFAVLGGAGNVLGPVVGALFLTSLPEIVRFPNFDPRDVISGAILIAVIIFRPQGIVGRGGLAIIRPRWWPRPDRASSAAQAG